MKTTFLLICLSNLSLAIPNLAQDHLRAGDYNALLRAKRKVQESSTNAIEYMEKLRNSLTDADGKPKLSHADDPTEVWAMNDKGKKHNYNS